MHGIVCLLTLNNLFQSGTQLCQSLYLGCCAVGFLGCGHVGLELFLQCLREVACRCLVLVQGVVEGEYGIGTLQLLIQYGFNGSGGGGILLCSAVDELGITKQQLEANLFGSISAQTYGQSTVFAHLGEDTHLITFSIHGISHCGQTWWDEA